MILIDYSDEMNHLTRRAPLADEERAAMRRCFDKVTAWCKAHPDRVPRLPHYRHTCLNPTTCTLEHDTYPSRS